MVEETCPSNMAILVRRLCRLEDTTGLNPWHRRCRRIQLVDAIDRAITSALVSSIYLLYEWIFSRLLKNHKVASDNRSCDTWSDRGGERHRFTAPPYPLGAMGTWFRCGHRCNRIISSKPRKLGSARYMDDTHNCRARRATLVVRSRCGGGAVLQRQHRGAMAICGRTTCLTYLHPTLGRRQLNRP